MSVKKVIILGERGNNGVYPGTGVDSVQGHLSRPLSIISL